jgi:hypothetical protein
VRSSIFPSTWTHLPSLFQRQNPRTPKRHHRTSCRKISTVLAGHPRFLLKPSGIFHEPAMAQPPSSHLVVDEARKTSPNHLARMNGAIGGFRRRHSVSAASRSGVTASCRLHLTAAGRARMARPDAPDTRRPAPSAQRAPLHTLVWGIAGAHQCYGSALRLFKTPNVFGATGSSRLFMALWGRRDGFHTVLSSSH